MSVKQLPFSISVTLSLPLRLKHKLFSSAIVTKGSSSNASMGFFDTGEPGSLPKINKEGIILALKLGKFLHFQPSKDLTFKRRIEFDPRCPKNYILTQSQTPLMRSGYYEFRGKKIRLEKLYLEEARARLLDNDTIDYTFAGMALVKLKSSNTFISVDEVLEFVSTLRAQLEEKKFVESSILEPKIDLFIYQNHNIEILEEIPFERIESELLRAKDLKDGGKKVFSSFENKIYVDEPDLPSYPINRIPF